MYFNIELENLLLLFSALGANYFIRQSIHVCLMCMKTVCSARVIPILA